MQNRPTVLLIHNESGICCSFRDTAARQGFELVVASTAAAGGWLLDGRGPDVVVLDLDLPNGAGPAALHRLRTAHPRCPVVLVASPATTEAALEAVRHGAFDYLLKPVDGDRLGGLLVRAAEAARLMKAPSLLPGGDGDERFLGRSLRMQELCATLDRLAPQDAHVLIQGESGTGKELVARALYQHSRRADRPFLAVRCADLPERLLESELFGHAPGAFPGADRRRVGKLEQCRGGTLLLDEVGDLPPGVQARLVRALPVGAGGVETGVRLLATCGRELDDLVAEGRFRADLGALLGQTAVTVPPLRKRREDIAELAHYFLMAVNGKLGLNLHGIAPEAIVCLQSYSWPGNVRELRSVVEEAMLRTRGPFVLLESLPEALCGGHRPEAAPAEGDKGLAALVRALLLGDEASLYARLTQTLDRVVLAEVLRHTRGNQKRASEILGIDRKTLRKKLQSFGLLPAPAGKG